MKLLKTFLNQFLIIIKIIERHQWETAILSLTVFIINVNINPNHASSFTDSPVWIKNRNTTLNPIHKKDNKSLRYAVTVVLNREGIKKRSAKNKKN